MIRDILAACPNVLFGTGGGNMSAKFGNLFTCGIPVIAKPRGLSQN
jgi:hypothetical protein